MREGEKERVQESSEIERERERERADLLPERVQRFRGIHDAADQQRSRKKRTTVRISDEMETMSVDRRWRREISMRWRREIRVGQRRM
jgi:hypothetical protein